MKKSMNHRKKTFRQTHPGTRDMMTSIWTMRIGINFIIDCENPSSSSARVLGSLECGTYEDELGASLPDVHAQATTDTKNASMHRHAHKKWNICRVLRFSFGDIQNVRRRPIDGKIRGCALSAITISTRSWAPLRTLSFGPST